MTENNPAIDKCIWTARFRRETLGSYQCIPCFINASLLTSTQPQVTVNDLFTTHCFVRGPYIPYTCTKCNKNITKEKPINQYQLCYEKCTELLAKMNAQGIRN